MRRQYEGAGRDAPSILPAAKVFYHRRKLVKAVLADLAATKLNLDANGGVAGRRSCEDTEGTGLHAIGEPDSTAVSLSML